MEQVQTVEMNQFGRRYKSGDRKKHGQKLDKWIFNEHSMVNSTNRYPHLTIGQHVSIFRCKGSERDDLICPADVEVRKQGVNAPLVVAVDNAP